MEKLILIDGNSLLNRAFYAMAPFTTREGLPTNGIFGFIKLMFRILEDEKPEYFVVTFDVHAPTFRHKIYNQYKGTRKPMPEELVVQVPVLKDLLRAMDICIVEKAGYEADDLIGTIARRFPEVETLIYTGDHDSYQLIDAHTSVCITKRGVTDIDRMTQDNFYEKEGITPSQVIELKALMGDNSDNIPGVKGIGPKSALSLLAKYHNLDGVYSHLDDLSKNVRQKLELGRDSAYLSRTLATIDTCVPLDLTLGDCILHLPFSENARKAFCNLEFRSLLGSKFFPSSRNKHIDLIECSDTILGSLTERAQTVNEFSLTVETDGIHYYDGDSEYLFRIKENFLEPGFFLSELKPLLEVLFSGSRHAVLNDVKSIAHFLHDAAGVTISCQADDVSLMRYLSDSNRKPAGAKELASEFAISEEFCAYALMLAYRDAVSHENKEDTILYRELELPLAHLLFDMEQTGVRVDTTKFPVFSERFNQEMQTLSTRIFQLAGTSFNLNSPFQLSEILFDRLGYSSRGIKKNLRGGYSTNADVLEKLAEDHEIAKLILKYREIQKLQSTYIDGIRPLVKGEIVHTTYYQTMTTTGRLSSANPNLQNIPVRTEIGRELRKLFIAREGNLLIDADYSQIELRLLAHFSECQALLDAYRNDLDIHAATASKLFGVPLDEVTPDLRRRAKTINFGIIYGMSAFGLAKDLGCSNEEAQRYINAYFSTHPEVRSYMENNVRRAKEDGYVTTLLGRKRYIAELKSSNFNQRAFGERAAMNMPLQGSAADIIKIAMLRVANRLKQERFAAKLVLQVHDELIIDAPEAEAAAAEQVLKEEMEAAVKLRVPLTVEISTGKSWYEAK